MMENGVRELEADDYMPLIEYFSEQRNKQIKYSDFLQIVLPCDDLYLRSAASQAPGREIKHDQLLPIRVEKALSQLLLKEVNFQLKLEELKKRLEISYDFTVKRAYASVDDWNYGYLDHSNIRRFLKNMGYRASKKEIVAILRRLDMDGDAKVSFKEFEAGFMPVTTKLTRPKSGT